MGIWPFRRPRSAHDAQALLALVSTASRAPEFYGPGGVPDTLAGRFEALTAHATLALVRLRSEPDAEALAQRFVDALFRQIDAGLREAAVGDLAVPKKIHRLAGDFYGRLDAYSPAIVAKDLAALEAALLRNVAGLVPSGAGTLGQRLLGLAKLQAANDISFLLSATAWTPPAP